ncbi:MAG: RtcB family protein, partial [Candidatus Micrarchaeaceae archaeon]
MYDLKRIGDAAYEIPKDEKIGMNVPVRLYANKYILDNIQKDRTLMQAVNASMLPSIVGNMLVMPDGHEGYGFPVGGVAAFDADNGIVSPGAIGFDVNCGIRLVKTNMSEADIRPKLNALMDALFKNVPSGVGSKIKLGFTGEDLDRVAIEGVEYIIGKGYGWPDDIDKTEENGTIAGADPDKVSSTAKARGKQQLGTLGAGNHFLEVQKVERVLDERLAKAFGLYEGQIVVMLHSGSRGYGHQVCSDYLDRLSTYQEKNGIKLPDPELAYAYLDSKEAQDYLGAMRSAVNFAFTNRQIMMNSIRKSFEEVFSKSSDSMGMEMLYDVAHNIAKLEDHVVEGKKMKLMVHRKGATRA